MKTKSIITVICIFISFSANAQLLKKVTEAAERSAELSVASDLLAMQGVDALATAAAAGEVAMAARAAGVTKIAQGAEAIGAGVATAAAGEALAARAG